ncbi:type II toxin-antitoxin system HicB family antitoxin [Actinoallomurus sp. NBC_01490]|uniref:type II toxin-antitoxin system HicB family antitoxin n=1 Tax=Actinoallomurus sp. NBC_01490 TaxID=2903557 RepID=UPI002E2FF795|nr:type II toxin-antitoxin system HicB family antitoxin [Actinoallomurus sp. NBC_01490]
MSRYAVVIEQAEDGGYGAYAPDLPGCVAVGETEAEVIALMRDAVELHLEAMREAGEQVPAPSTVSVAVIEAA